MSILGEPRREKSKHVSTENKYVVTLSEFDLEVILQAVGVYMHNERMRRKCEVVIDKIYESMGYKAK